MRIDKQVEESDKKYKGQKGVSFVQRVKSNEVNYVFIENSKKK
jgi:hypothetical protein